MGYQVPGILAVLVKAVIHRMVFHLARACADFHPAGAHLAEAPMGYQPLGIHQVGCHLAGAHQAMVPMGCRSLGIRRAEALQVAFLPVAGHRSQGGVGCRSVGANPKDRARCYSMGARPVMAPAGFRSVGIYRAGGCREGCCAGCRSVESHLVKGSLGVRQVRTP